MKNEYLINYLANADLSFLENVKDEIIEVKNKKDILQFNEVKNINENWLTEIAEMETYFASIQLPTQPIKLNECSIITNCTLFIESHFTTVKANNENNTFLPYLNRLRELKTTISDNKLL